MNGSVQDGGSVEALYVVCGQITNIVLGDTAIWCFVLNITCILVYLCYVLNVFLLIIVYHKVGKNGQEVKIRKKLNGTSLSGCFDLKIKIGMSGICFRCFTFRIIVCFQMILKRLCLEKEGSMLQWRNIANCDLKQCQVNMQLITDSE